jgi:hypothetical protein
MNFRDPWVDPRVLLVRPADAQRYLLVRGWRLLGPSGGNPDLILFDGPGTGEGRPLVPVPVHTDQGADVQRLVELLAELARFEGRYVGDILTDILWR